MILTGLIFAGNALLGVVQVQAMWFSQRRELDKVRKDVAVTLMRIVKLSLRLEIRAATLCGQPEVDDLERPGRNHHTRVHKYSIVQMVA